MAHAFLQIPRNLAVEVVSHLSWKQQSVLRAANSACKEIVDSPHAKRQLVSRLFAHERDFTTKGVRISEPEEAETVCLGEWTSGWFCYWGDTAEESYVFEPMLQQIKARIVTPPAAYETWKVDEWSDQEVRNALSAVSWVKEVHDYFRDNIRIASESDYPYTSFLMRDTDPPMKTALDLCKALGVHPRMGERDRDFWPSKKFADRPPPLSDLATLIASAGSCDDEESDDLQERAAEYFKDSHSIFTFVGTDKMNPCPTFCLKKLPGGWVGGLLGAAIWT